MSSALKLFGIILLLFSAMVFSSEYRKRARLKRDISEGFLLLAEHLRRQIDCYLTPAVHLADGFTNKALESCGFLDEAKQKGVCAAFLAMSDMLTMYQSVKEKLTLLFSNFGKDYRDGTLRELSNAIAAVKELVEKENEESDRDVKVVGIVAVAIALGVTILII